MNFVPTHAKCPTCGHQASTPDLWIDLQSGEVGLSGKTIQVRPRHAEILHILKAKMPRYANAEEVRGLLIGDNSPETCDALVRVHVSQLRKALKGFPLTVEGKWGYGYRLIVNEEGFQG